MTQHSIPMYEGVTQIGGQETVRPAPRRGVGRGNTSIQGRCNLAAMRQLNSPNITSILPAVPPKGIDAILPHGRSLRQTTLGGWHTNSHNNRDPIHKDSPQLLSTEFAGLGIDDSVI